MKKHNFFIPITSYQLLMTVFCFCLCACGASQEPSNGVSYQHRNRGADQTIEGFSVDAYVQGKLDWVLKAPVARVYEQTHRIDVDGPFIQFFDEEAPGSTLKALRGEVNSETNDMWAWDNVVMVSTDGAHLTTDSMQYVSAEDKIVSTAPVTIVRENSVIQGVGWEARPDLSEMSVFNQIVEMDR